MSPKLNLRRSLALTTALVVTAFGAAPAVAYDPGSGNGGGNGNAGSSASADPGKSSADQAKDKDKGKNSGGSSDPGGSSGKGDGTSGSKGGGKGGGKSGGSADNPGNGNSNAGGNANSNAGGKGGGNAGGNGNGGGKGDKGPKGDPAGNNGTVKITPILEDDGTPQNTPHVVCGFDIEWYGFDQGDDIISTVTFTPHAPTSDVVLGGTEPAEVFVGGDPASGAGTDSGLDGEQTYYLTFSGGEPHPKQGYHVKLTVNTPGSQGADVKHKVFWVQPCDDVESGDEEPCVDDTTTEADECEETEGEVGDEEPCVDDTTTEADECEEVEGTQECTDGTVEGEASEDCDEVAGTQEGDDDSSITEGTTPDVAGTQASAGDEVPSAVDAGEQGNPVVNAITSPLGLILILGGLAIAGAALVARRQTS